MDFSLMLIIGLVVLLAGVFIFYSVKQKKKKEEEVNGLKMQLQKAIDEKNHIERTIASTSGSIANALAEKTKIEQSIKELLHEKAKMEGEKKKFEEKNKKMWQMSVAIHKEKERINKLRLEIEEKHQNVIDSVNYAKRIQEAILPPLEEINRYLPQSFVLFKPRDIVSGDFFWFRPGDNTDPLSANKAIIAAVDCTGHGVPGAFMSMIGNTLLNEIVGLKGITEPAEILNNLNEAVVSSLKQDKSDSESRDGMDIAICSLDFSSMELQYSGANRSLYLLRGGISNPGEDDIEEIKANKFAIGGLNMGEKKVYTNHSLKMAFGDTFYIFTDGYADQFGGPDGRKLMTKKFKKILCSIKDKTMREQQVFLQNYMDEWKGTNEQVDDILVIGIRI